jgi:hypothetical protein
MKTKINRDFIPKPIDFSSNLSCEKFNFNGKSIEEVSYNEIANYGKFALHLTLPEDVELGEYQGSRLITIKSLFATLVIGRAISKSTGVLGGEKYWNSLPKWERMSFLKRKDDTSERNK